MIENDLFHMGYVMGVLRKQETRQYFLDRGVCEMTLDTAADALHVLYRATYRMPVLCFDVEESDITDDPT